MTKHRMLLAHADSLILIHFVWSTRNRVRVLLPADDAWFVTELRESAYRGRAKLIAAGLAWDHVHCLVAMPTTRTIADLAQRLKGATSHAWNQRPERWCNLRWQEGYWARSFDQNGLPSLLEYLTNQRTRHDRGAADATLEQTAAAVARPA